MKKIITSLAICVIIIAACFITADASDNIGMTASSDSVKSISVMSYPTKTVYGAFERLDTNGLTVRVVYDDGSEEIISGDKLTVSYRQDTCLRFGDASVTLSYKGKSILLPITVNRIEYDLSVLELSDFSLPYTGKYQSYTEMLPTVIGLDGIPLIMTAAGGSVNAGSYDISIDFHTESRDYLLPDSRVVTMSIDPAVAEIVWSEISFIYDGRSKVPSAYYIDVSGTKIYPSVSGAATNAGDKYTARAMVTDPNYEFVNTSIGFEIKKADYDFSTVVWSEGSFVYDGSAKSISASGLPAGVSIVGYSGDRGVNAGNYTATATLSWDSVNYNTPAPLTQSWEILPAEYDMSGVSFLTKETVYDGNIHYPTLSGRMPVGADGITLGYVFSAGACHVSEGVVSVVISFVSDSRNYILPEPMYSSVTVKPKGISAEWGNSELEYSGEIIAPIVTSTECQLRCEGGGINVGKYTAKAVTDNTDYYILNDTMDFTIVKADNYWISTPGFTTSYEGRALNLSGEGKFGEIEYLFFSDAEGKKSIYAPTKVGRYYAVALVGDTENYSGLRSEIFEFEIVEIKPVSFFAVIEKTRIKAFERLSAADIICSVINNDGSVTAVDSSLVDIIYEQGDSFRKSDSVVTLGYNRFMLSLEVEVDYADYDLSKVVWLETNPTYDGNEKSPVLSGLPDGVSVIEYVGAGVINAGRYQVTALLSYDTENYNPPDIDACDFVISKRVIDIPLMTAVYNGDTQYPASDSELYFITEDVSGALAGDYGVRVRLIDTDNYTFVGETEECTATFRILPATIFVTVSDVSLHLFKSLGIVGYEFTRGGPIGEDVISVSQYTLDDSVFVRSDNPNYIFEVTPGRINRLPYPTLKDTINILIFLSILLVLILCALVAYKKRRRILNLASIVKCRWHNRHLSVCAPDDGMGRREIEHYIDTAKEDNTELYPPEEGGEINFPPSDEEYSILDFGVDAERADTLITDSLAKNLLRKKGDIVYTSGDEREVINLHILSDNFSSGDIVDINVLKEKGLVSQNTSYIKVLAGGTIDKPLTVYANDFSISAIKMIALTGGEAIKCVSVDKKSD